MKKIILVLLGLIVLAGLVSADAVFVQHSQPDFSNYYMSEGRLSTYYPILGQDRASCSDREDVILQIDPAGCQPAVVRSDLLGEQNVPVFCQIDAIKTNPFLDIDQIRNIRFSVVGQPANVAGVGFHPARAALRTNDILLGSPVEDNIGYAVVVLKKQPNEALLPENVSVQLRARLDYYAGNALGIGRSEFLLQEISDEKWENDRLKQSFFNGQYAVRLIDAEPESARIAVYEGDKRVQELVVDRSKGGELFLPGGYCRVGLKVDYDGFISADRTAFLNVDGDLIEVHRSGKFLNGKCSVRQIEYKGNNDGSVEISCGRESFDLLLRPVFYQIGEEVEFIANIASYQAGVWRVESIDGGNLSIIQLSGENNAPVGKPIEVESGWMKSLDKTKLYEADYGDEVNTYFRKTIDEYEFLADEYPQEKNTNSNQSYSEQGLWNAILLAGELNKKVTQDSLLTRFEELYPEGYKGKGEALRNEIYRVDSSDAVKVVDIEDGFKTIRLVELREPENKSKATFIWGTQKITLEDDKNHTLSNGDYILVTQINADNAQVSWGCKNDRSFNRSSARFSLSLDEDTSQDVCGQSLKIDDIELRQFARIRINPESKAYGETNLTVNIGIEKRAFQLNPDKAEEKIKRLNETIAKWESISSGLGDTVKGLKAACFATSGVLTIKNFFSGLSGAAIAREKAMRGPGGWTEKCQQQAKAEGISLDACFSKNAKEIDRDVKALSGLIESDNEKLKQLTEKNTKKNTLGGILGTASVDGKNITDGFIDENYNSQIKGEKISLADGNVSVGDLVDAKSPQGDRYLSATEARDMKLWIDVRNSPETSGVMKERANAELKRIGQGIADRKRTYEPIEGLPDSLQNGGLSQSAIGSYGGKDTITGDYYGGVVSNGEYGLTGLEGSTPAQVITYNNKPYLLLLQSTGSGNYAVTKAYEWDTSNKKIGIESPEIIENFRAFAKIDSSTYVKKINNPEVQYYEQGDYKGMPALVPFDPDNGWYAATQQSLPGFGNIKAFESNGRVVSFWLCHVDGDGNMDFLKSDFGDDKCRQFNMNTGQPLDKFPGLSEGETKRKVDQAVQALNDAARGYGKGDRVSILGESRKVGKPASPVPGTQCQDFMSPDDCKLLFNVCDPVICPTSRCDFGGRYPVDDVVQSGIVGSALLCLPNSVAFGGDVYVPVCLTGIKAGVDNYLSILEQHKACLQENIDSGRTVGICDEITSVYTCEFFWRQAAPLTKALLPKIVEFAYSGGRGQVRGGGEYLTVQSAFDNTEQSIDYFTNYYAGNTFDAFRARSVEEAGSEVCRAFISAKAPTDFDTLLEADSPPQFSAFFSEIPYTDATVPATSQYKVFYHIFAGNDRGVSFNVYLKDPPETSYYNSNPTIQVASGFVGRGQSVSETKDFTTPAGYKQLCVMINGKEECGFKQVSTSFALNYAKDEIVKGELLREDIQGEKECISGSVNPSALLNPNIQEAGQEVIDPAIYNRGVVRICSTDNPGTGTNPTRFLDVGYCSNERVRCWLDSQSVDNALTENNKGARNDTLTELNKRAGALLESQGNEADFIIGTRAENYYSDLDEKFKNRIDTEPKLEWKGKVNVTEADRFAGVIDEAVGMMYLSVDKARLLLMKANVYEAVTRKLASEKGFIVVADQPPASEDNVVGESSTQEDAPVGETKEVVLENNFIVYEGKTTLLYLNPLRRRGSYEIKENKVLGDKVLGYIIKNDDGSVRISLTQSAASSAYLSVLNKLVSDYTFDSDKGQFVLKSQIEAVTMERNFDKGVSGFLSNTKPSAPIQINVDYDWQISIDYRFNRQENTWEYQKYFSWISVRDAESLSEEQLKIAHDLRNLIEADGYLYFRILRGILSSTGEGSVEGLEIITDKHADQYNEAAQKYRFDESVGLFVPYSQTERNTSKPRIKALFFLSQGKRVSDVRVGENLKFELENSCFIANITIAFSSDYGPGFTNVEEIGEDIYSSLPLDTQYAGIYSIEVDCLDANGRIAGREEKIIEVIQDGFPEG